MLGPRPSDCQSGSGLLRTNMAVGESIARRGAHGGEARGPFVFRPCDATVLGAPTGTGLTTDVFPSDRVIWPHDQ